MHTRFKKGQSGNPGGRRHRFVYTPAEIPVLVRLEVAQDLFFERGRLSGGSFPGSRSSAGTGFGLGHGSSAQAAAALRDAGCVLGYGRMMDRRGQLFIAHQGGAAAPIRVYERFLPEIIPVSH